MQEFRRDIQGLRALAVLPVVLFHFGVGILPGGFVGVDVFFVISGFVISKGLIETVESGSFTFTSFYGRRLRRILPALVATCLFTALAAWRLLLPRDFVNFSRSLTAVLISTSNFWFWKTSGYFEPESHSEPLLHCWSLAVEEQFYLCWPLVMVLGARWLKGRWLWLIVPVMIASLAICIAMVFVAPSAGFYLLPSRAWELMAGAAVAAISNRQSSLSGTNPGKLVCECTAILGFALVGWSILFLHETDVFPGWNAIAPVVGAALMIWAGTGPVQPRINKMLALKPIAAVGTISYSLYLVHWPIAAFFYYYFLRAPTSREAVVMVGLSLLLAGSSYLLIEEPIRKSKPHSRNAMTAVIAIMFFGLIGFGIAVERGQGMPQRYPTFAEVDVDATSEWGRPHCFNYMPSKPIAWDLGVCTRTHGHRHRILLWGDSFAAHYIPGLMHDSSGSDADILEYTSAGCPPVLAFHALGQHGCSITNSRVPIVIKQAHVDTVVIAARWTNLQQRTLLRLHETVATLRGLGVRVFVIGQSPEFSADPQRIDLFSGQHAASNGVWRITFDPAIEGVIARESTQASFINPLTALCRSNICPYRIGKTWLYTRDSHYSAAGSLLAVRSYFPLARQQGASLPGTQ